MQLYLANQTAGLRALHRFHLSLTKSCQKMPALFLRAKNSLLSSSNVQLPLQKPSRRNCDLWICTNEAGVLELSLAAPFKAIPMPCHRGKSASWCLSSARTHKIKRLIGMITGAGLFSGIMETVSVLSLERKADKVAMHHGPLLLPHVIGSGSHMLANAFIDQA
jgi:hypothetical protein